MARAQEHGQVFQFRAQSVQQFTPSLCLPSDRGIDRGLNRTCVGGCNLRARDDVSKEIVRDLS